MILTQAISRAVSCCSTQCKTPAFFRAAACAVLAAVFASSQLASATIVRIETNLGGFNVELYDAQAPLTVANFLNYANRGDYNGTVIHRSAVTGDPPVPFVIQGGGYRCCLFGTLYHFPTDPPVPNEFDPSRSNVRGTIAMAKSADPDSATSEWFINLGDNSAALDDINNSGGFTVFGHVLDPGMNAVDAIASLPIVPIPGFEELPGIDGNFMTVTQICANTEDSDGACTATEDLAPGGDGNGDGIPDRDQSNVTTIQTLLGATATFAAEPMMRLDPVIAVYTSTATTRLTTFKSPPDQSVHFNNGMYTFSMTGVIGPAGSIVTMYDGATARPTHYYAYGPTPDNPTPHWYDFTFDGVTGAEIKNDRIILHFADGMRGDDDLTANNSITHTGAQAVVTAMNDSSAQGGGCSIAGIPPDVTRGGDWIVVSLFLAMLAFVRRRARSGRHQSDRSGEDTNIASP